MFRLCAFDFPGTAGYWIFRLKSRFSGLVCFFPHLRYAKPFCNLPERTPKRLPFETVKFGSEKPVTSRFLCNQSRLLHCKICLDKDDLPLLLQPASLRFAQVQASPAWWRGRHLEQRRMKQE